MRPVGPAPTYTSPSQSGERIDEYESTPTINTEGESMGVGTKVDEDTFISSRRAFTALKVTVRVQEKDQVVRQIVRITVTGHHFMAWALERYNWGHPNVKCSSV